MTRWIGMLLIAVGAISTALASATESQAWGHRRGCGSNGGGGSWGNGGSNGGGGSFGGLFSRSRNGSHGGWGSNGGRHGNGWGSSGGRHQSNGCGSHGGAYHGETVEVHSAHGNEGEVRYYGDRAESSAPMDAPAPVLEDDAQVRSNEESQNVNTSNRADLNADQRTNVSQPNAAGQPGEFQENVSPPAPPAGGAESNISPPQGGSVTGEVGT